MPDPDPNPETDWQRKGATVSDKTARQEFGLTQPQIVAATRTGQLHFKKASMHGSPWLRLLRREVEAPARPELTSSMPWSSCGQRRTGWRRRLRYWA